MLQKRNKASLLLIISLIAAASFSVQQLSAANPTEVAVINPLNPSNPGAKDGKFTFYTNTTSVGHKFNATIWLYDYGTPPIFAWQIRLNFNPALLEIEPNRAWNAVGEPSYIFAGRGSLNLAPVIGVGTILLGDSLLGGNGEAPPPSPAKLATVEFKIISAPPPKGKVSCSLDINNADASFLDDSLTDIPIVKRNGLYEFIEPSVKPPPATMYVDPAKVIDPLLVPSNNFDVNIAILGATDVYSYEFILGFNKTVLNVADANLGGFFPPGSSVIKTIDNVAGSMLFNATLVPPEPPKTGSGVLAVVTFHVMKLGESVIDLQTASLSDEAKNPLDLNPLQDGFFSNIRKTKLYIDPPLISDPLMKPPRIFSVDVVIDDVEDLYGYEFKLGYNTHMLTAIGVEIHPILGEGNFTTDWWVKDSVGQIWINVTYYPPATPITTYTPEALATITFKVDAVGSSPLDLYDTKLIDHTGTEIGHEVTDGFVFTEIHDVAITNVVPSTTSVFAGEPVYIDVTAKNKGNVTETFDVKAYYDSNLIGTQPIPSLAPNAETTLTFTWDTTGVTDGVYTIKGEATLVPFEFNAADNTYIDGTVEVQTRIRNLAILSVTAEPDVTYADPNWPVTITVVAKNKGMDPETFDVSVFWNDTNLIATKPVTDLPPDTETTLSFTWDTTNLLVCHRYKISASATILEHEIDTTDNWLDDGYVKIKVMGDLNGDGKVDIKDLAILAQAFGSYPGHPRWNPAADLNRDLKVDIRDIALGASNFGKGCTP